MNRALCLIREQLVYRREAFVAGLSAAGYEVVSTLPKPDPGDVLVIWNRYGHWDDIAKSFEARNAKVVVCENGYLGKSFLGDTWFALALGQHNGAGVWVGGGPQRWDDLGVELSPWKTGGTEVLVLGQRGIGSSEVRSPPFWAETIAATIGGRIRPHPGNDEPKKPLREDLARACCVVTWGSCAALGALMAGVPVFYAAPNWIGAGASRPLSEWGAEPKRDDAARLDTFRRLIWAQWRIGEIKEGKAFRHLLA